MKVSKPIYETQDKDGTRVIRVPLGRKQDLFAEIEAVDFHYLRELGLTPNWSKGANNNVKASCRAANNDYVLVARVLTQAKEHEKILYKDKNPLNLRQSNIIKVWSPRKDLRNHHGLVLRTKDLSSTKAASAV
jgi:hypothetical protein